MIGLSMSLLGSLADRALPTVVTVGNEWLITAPDFDPWSRLCRRWPWDRPRAVAGVPTALPSLDRARVNFVSEFVKQRSIERSQWRVDPGSPVVHPGIDVTDFPVEPRRLRPRPWSWRLLYVGRVDPVKGVGTLIQGFAQLPPQATLEIIGGGPLPYIAEMKRLAEELGVAARVSFSRCPRERLRSKYLAADVLVFPSEWDDPFGLVPLEAMACGVPVVATATGGAAEFLRDRDNCLLFAARDASALAGAVRELAADDDLVRSLTEGGTRTASTFTIDRYAQRLLDLHTAVVVTSAGER
jgi:glycosyltransferase involved in cell wall biosynthesis